MNFLDTILKEKKDAISKKKKNIPLEKILSGIKPPFSQSKFKSILKSPALHIIAEIKRTSPSKGDLNPDLNIIEVVKIYQEQGIELVSVLCEEKFFKGSFDDLVKIKQNTNLCVLCKDFIIDTYQIYEAKLYNADAILLIVRILSVEQLKEFLGLSNYLRMDTVVEIHSQDDLEKIKNIVRDIQIIGINRRDLEDFSIDLESSQRLLPKIPKDKIVIVESGIDSPQEIRHFKEIGVNGVLIGESLMKAKDIVGKLKEFKEATAN